MKRRPVIWLAALFVGVVAAGWTGLRRVSLRALDEPGRAETYVATKTKRVLVGRAAHHIPHSPQRDPSQSVMIGQMQFRARCAACHGLDGRTPSEIGSAMYPRASDLGSADVQAWSDAELFWIIQNGIRMTGMPGFGKNLSDGEIWPLVDYIRSVRANSQRQQGNTSSGASSTESREANRWRAR
jgi:mono/diheme cytochrome c family protein